MNEGSSKALLPLVEILISIGIFAIAVILTLQLFLLARFLGDKTSDTARAIFEVQNVAENVKTMKTNAEMLDYIESELSGSHAEADAYYYLYYDNDWNIIDIKTDEAVFMMKINIQKDEYNSGGLYRFNLDFYKIKPYPFINDKNIKKDKDFIPLLASVNANKFILNQEILY